MSTMNMQNNVASMPQRGKQGFASMSRDAQREIASKGGKAAHKKGTAHEWSSDEARRAGKKGGTKSTSPKSSN